MKNTRNSRKPKLHPAAATVRLVQIPNARDADGEPRVALEVPPGPGAVSRPPVLMLFGSMAAALATKHLMEGGR